MSVESAGGDRAPAPQAFVETERSDTPGIGLALADDEGADLWLSSGIGDFQPQQRNKQDHRALVQHAGIGDRKLDLAFIPHALPRRDAFEDMLLGQVLPGRCDLLFDWQVAVR